ncbi:urease subunit beta [Chitinophaga qingshengii]|uniref:Urease subunit beta n=1 Tax=Chitinophaga qingshengii TaxID=1569794 RepID=A0ABR7TS78_9BACT|nr:urease subunit beta [Chitinophaga qingshengii]MBC9932321.1 urease subunit beta [Chitinophaga qingshengii]
MIPGEYFLGKGDVHCNEGRKTVTIKVINTADRPVQIGSHYHFFEVNRQMSFDRAQAFGKRLNIPAGTAVRFEPGEEKEVTLVELGGARRAFGLNNLVQGDTALESSREKAMAKLATSNFKNQQS